MRAFDDSSFDRAIFLNDENGAYGAGHNATMLLNSSGEGLVFSYYPTSQESEWDLVFGVDGEMRIGVLTADQANNLMYGDGWTGQMVATDGHLENEQYERFAYYDISGGQVYNMYHKATEIFQNPGTYKLAGNQCDDITQQIFAAGEINYAVRSFPNWSYNDLENSSKWTR